MSKKLHNRAAALPTLMWLMLLALLPAQLSARDFDYTYEGQTLTYTVLDEDAKTVQTKEGSCVGYNHENCSGNNVSGNLILPETVSDGVDTYTVTDIGRSSFEGCRDLISIVIPNSVITIGQCAFERCLRLRSVAIPNSVTYIGEYAFGGCHSLIKSAYPSSIDNPFGCGVMICYPGKGSYIDENGCVWSENKTRLYFVPIHLEGEFIIPNSVISVCNNAFYDCFGLTSIDIPDSVVSIGRNSFFNCPGLTSVIIGNAVTNIGDSAFKGGSKLSTVSFGTSIETIGVDAFNGCALTELVLPPHVKTVGDNAFAGNNIKNIAIGSEITEIGEKAFDGANELAGVSITALTPPMANNNTFSYYACPLYVTPGCVDTYYNFTHCWYRFTGYELIPIEKLEVEGKATVALNPGETHKFNVAITPANASLPYIFWRSTNPEFATVDNDGNVTLVGNGVESAQADGDVVTECRIIAETLYADGPVAEFTVQDYASAIDDIVVDTPAAPERPNDIYNLQGICLKRNASQEDVDALAPGLYIIGGKKVLVK